MQSFTMTPNHISFTPCTNVENNNRVLCTGVIYLFLIFRLTILFNLYFLIQIRWAIPILLPENSDKIAEGNRYSNRIVFACPFRMSLL